MAEEATDQQIWAEEAAKLVVKAADEQEFVPTSVEQEPEPEPEPEPAPVDPFAGVPEIVREKLTKLDELAASNAQLMQHVRTAEGRVAAMQREFDVAKQKATAVKDTPSAAQIAEAAKSPEKWAAMKEEFQDISEAVEEYVTHELSKRTQGSAQGLSPEKVTELVEAGAAKVRDELTTNFEKARIEDRHEGWQEKVKAQEFGTWYNAQTPEIQALAHSTSARDAIRMLDKYEESKKKGKASQIKEARNDLIAAAATTRPGSTPPPPRSVEDMTPTELWNYEAEQRQKRQARLGY